MGEGERGRDTKAKWQLCSCCAFGSSWGSAISPPQKSRTTQIPRCHATLPPDPAAYFLKSQAHLPKTKPVTYKTRFFEQRTIVPLTILTISCVFPFHSFSLLTLINHQPATSTEGAQLKTPVAQHPSSEGHRNIWGHGTRRRIDAC